MSVTEKLSAPFDPSVVKQRDGRGGIKLDYIAGEDVKLRYIEELGLAFGWRIQQVGFNVDEVFIIGELSVNDDGLYSTRAGVGASELVSTKGVRKALDDAIKTANTEAFKNAATYFGTALYLWYEEEREKIAEYRETGGDSLTALKMEVYEKAQIDMASADPDPQYIAEFYEVTLDELGEEDVLRRILAA